MIEDKIKEILDKKEYLEKSVLNEYIIALSMLIGIFLAGGISFVVLKNWLVVIATIVGTSIPFDIYYYRTDKTKAEIKELDEYLKDLYSIKEKRGGNPQENYTEDMNNNMGKVNSLVNEKNEYDYFTSSNVLRRVRKISNEKKINYYGSLSNSGCKSK